MSEHDTVPNGTPFRQVVWIEVDIEAIDAIEDWDLGFHDGNALKYIARHKHKQNPCEDIEKAIWYLERHLEILKANND